MASGLSWVWLVTWSLWAVVVYKDSRRQPRDWRWLVSLGALIVIAWATWDSFREVNLRFILLAGLAVLILVGWTVLDAIAGRRRSQFSRWAADHGFEPRDIEPRRTIASLPDGLRRLPILSQGGSPFTVGLVAQSSEAQERLVFDHTIRRKVIWYDANGVETTGTVVAIRRPGMWLPLFQIRPVGTTNAMDGGPLGDAVPLGTNSAFAKSYRLGGHEPRNLRTVFTDELLATIAEKPGWLIEGEGQWIACYYFDRTENLMSLKTSKLRIVQPDQLADHVREATRILERIAARDRQTSSHDVGAA